MVLAAAVGNKFLELSRKEPNCSAMDQMKLQKLLFYAHAWWLAIEKKILFPEDIEAWTWGPVVRDIYSQTACFGRQPVAGNLRALDDNGNWIFPRLEEKSHIHHVGEVWNTHKNLTGIQLANSTHAPGEPWTIVYDKCGGDLSSSPVIPNGLIKKIFEVKLAD